MITSTIKNISTGLLIIAGIAIASIVFRVKVYLQTKLILFPIPRNKPPPQKRHFAHKLLPTDHLAPYLRYRNSKKRRVLARNLQRVSQNKSLESIILPIP